MVALRNYILRYPVLIVNITFSVKHCITGSVFVDKPLCYRQAFSEEVITFVNKSFHQTQDILFKQVTCYSKSQNTFCTNFEENYTAACTVSNLNETLRNSTPTNHRNITHVCVIFRWTNAFPLRCPLVAKNQQNIVVKAQAFRNHSLIGESSSISLLPATSTCYCNWSDLVPKVTFIPTPIVLPRNKKVTAKLIFKMASHFTLKLAAYLVGSSTRKTISDKQTLSGNGTITFNLDHLIGCNEHSFVVNLSSQHCIRSHELIMTIPKKLKTDFKVSQKDFICKLHGDKVILHPSSLNNFNYTIKNSDGIVQEGSFNKREIKLKKNFKKNIQIKICKMVCVCSNYVELKNCHFKKEAYKRSKVTLSVLLVSVALLLMVCVAFFIIRKKRQITTPEAIFDDSTVPMVESQSEVQPFPVYSTTVPQNEDETFDQLYLSGHNPL